MCEIVILFLFGFCSEFEKKLVFGSNKFVLVRFKNLDLVQILYYLLLNM